MFRHSALSVERQKSSANTTPRRSMIAGASALRAIICKSQAFVFPRPAFKRRSAASPHLATHSRFGAASRRFLGPHPTCRCGLSRLAAVLRAWGRAPPPPSSALWGGPIYPRSATRPTDIPTPRISPIAHPIPQPLGGAACVGGGSPWPLADLGVKM